MRTIWFTQRYVAPILAGTKTSTIRGQSRRPPRLCERISVSVGSRPAFVYAQVVDIRPMTLQRLDDETARRRLRQRRGAARLARAHLPGRTADSSASSSRSTGANNGSTPPGFRHSSIRFGRWGAPCRVRFVWIDGAISQGSTTASFAATTTASPTNSDEYRLSAMSPRRGVSSRTIAIYF
jgi:uncharacterized protein YqfB (UPF0267 family)